MACSAIRMDGCGAHDIPESVPAADSRNPAVYRPPGNFGKVSVPESPGFGKFREVRGEVAAPGRAPPDTVGARRFSRPQFRKLEPPGGGGLEVSKRDSPATARGPIVGYVLTI